MAKHHLSPHAVLPVDTVTGTVEIRIFREYRRNVRISLLEGYAHLRLPVLLSAPEYARYLTWATNWVQRRTRKIAASREEAALPVADGAMYTLLGDPGYHLVFQPQAGASEKAALQLTGHTFRLSFPPSWAQTQIREAFLSLLPRLLIKAFTEKMTRRVHELNERHFHKKIEGVKLKHNKSNWGSCSIRKNINLAVRLLFAPPEVIDYVIIHELAHLTEMNHSPRFWALVAKADPSYPSKEEWLKKHSRAFLP